MRLRATYERGVLRPKEPLPLAEGAEVELVTVPDLTAWIGVLANPDGESSVDVQHEVSRLWATKHVSR